MFEVHSCEKCWIFFSDFARAAVQIEQINLNSFYENHVDRDQTIIELNKLIGSLKPYKGPYLMVTHYVVVQAISQLSVSSGGMVVYDMISKKSKYLVDLKNFTFRS